MPSAKLPGSKKIGACAGSISTALGNKGRSIESQLRCAGVEATAEMTLYQFSGEGNIDTELGFVILTRYTT
jgi:hypothetical protein